MNRETRLPLRRATEKYQPSVVKAVAKHLATLGRAGLVSESRRGREHRFELDPQPLTDAAAWLTTVGAEWDSRLANLQRLVDAKRP